MTEGTDLNQTSSITFHGRMSRTCQTWKSSHEEGYEGDFTDDFLDDEEVEADYNDNEE